LSGLILGAKVRKAEEKGTIKKTFRKSDEKWLKACRLVSPEIEEVHASLSPQLLTRVWPIWSSPRFYLVADIRTVPISLLCR
jgi:hypothetical protein